MAPEPNRDPRSGGFLLAIAIIAGAVGGTIGGRSSVGLVVGLAAGLIMLLFVWLTDRRSR